MRLILGWGENSCYTLWAGNRITDREQVTIRHHPLSSPTLLSFLLLPFNETHVNVGRATQGVGSLSEAFRWMSSRGKLSIGQKKKKKKFCTFLNKCVHFIFAYTGPLLLHHGLSLVAAEIPVCYMGGLLPVVLLLLRNMGV